MSSRFDDDVQARITGGPERYWFGAQGPVYAVPIERDGSPVAFLFHGSDDEPDAAGLVASMSGDFQPVGSGHWLGVLAELRAKNVPAAEAIRSLVGATGPESAGRVGTELTRYDGKHELERLLNPSRPDRSRRAEQTGRERERSAAVSRQEIDDALRSDAPLTERVAERIRTLDAVLDAKPTREPIVVSLFPSSSRIPTSPEPGLTVVEPSYLTSFLASSDETLPAQPVVVKLRVPPGTPALFIEPSVPGDAGTLLLGRGIHWTIDRVVSSNQSTLITGHVTARSPRSVPVAARPA